MMDNVKTEDHISTADLVAGREGSPARPHEDGPGPLLPPDYVNDLRGKWDRIQTGFVDEPRVAVQQADELVASAIKRLAELFAEERSKLERQWDRGDDVSTEDLRVALRTYRSFFQRLLEI